MQTRVVVCAALALAVMALTAGQCHALAIIPDNGGGTAHMPIHSAYPLQDPMQIFDGLPPGTTININGVLTAPGATAEEPGGTLGGRVSAAAGLGFQWTMQGTGSLAGYTRNLFVPLGTFGSVASFPTAPANSGIEVHAAPRIPGDPVQTFDTDMFRLFGQVIGDPDFDLLRITAGTNFGLPSPGHTTLTRLGPPGSDWAVDSFFDITYRIDFVGHPGGPFSGQSGSTTGTVRISTVPEPGTLALAATGVALAVVIGWPRRRGVMAAASAINSLFSRAIRRPQS